MDGDTLYPSLDVAPTHGTATCYSYYWYQQGCWYAAEVGYAGPDTFTYRIDDGYGGVSTATVAVTVTENALPDAVDDSATVRGAAELTIDVVANDTDADDTPIIWAVTSCPSHGSVYCGGALCHYTAQTGYVGSDAFSYEIRDGHGGSDTATVTLTVDANEAPVANGDTIEVRGTESGSVGVLANDTDAEADPLTVVDHSGATHGNVWCTTGGSCTYQSTDPLFAGGDSFTYALSDGHGGSVTGTVTVTVTENAQPVVTDDELTVTDTESGSVDVLANDTDADDTLSIRTHTQPTSGSVWCSGGLLPLHPDHRHRGHGGQLHLQRHRRPRRDRHRDRVHHDRPRHPAGSGGRHRHDPRAHPRRGDGPRQRHQRGRRRVRRLGLDPGPPGW